MKTYAIHLSPDRKVVGFLHRCRQRLYVKSREIFLMTLHFLKQQTFLNQNITIIRCPLGSDGNVREASILLILYINNFVLIV